LVLPQLYQKCLWTNYQSSYWCQECPAPMMLARCYWRIKRISRTDVKKALIADGTFESTGISGRERIGRWILPHWMPVILLTHHSIKHQGLSYTHFFSQQVFFKSLGYQTLLFLDLSFSISTSKATATNYSLSDPTYKNYPFCTTKTPYSKKFCRLFSSSSSFSPFSSFKESASLGS